MDAKIPVPSAERAVVSRWLSRALSTASRALTRTPLDEALRVYSIFGPSSPPTGRMAQSVNERSMSRQPGAVSDGGLGEKSGLHA
jgi:hypothetical protein